VLYNFPFERKVAGKTMFPTVAKLPKWATNAAYRNAVAMPGKAVVKVVGEYSEHGLGEPLEFPDAPKTLSWEETLDWVKEVAPLEEDQIVEWMHTATAANVMVSRFMEEYKRAGSGVVGVADDGYIPGVKVEDLRFRSERGRTVASRGNAVVVTPRGNFNVPVPGKATGIFKDILCFGAVLQAFLKQWVAVLLKFKELATNPSDRISFPSFRGLVAPLFFTHQSTFPSPVNLVEFSVSTDVQQKIVVRGRSVDDYRDVLFEDKIDLSRGQNVIEYPLFGFPVVPTMVIEIQPEDNTRTILDYWNVYP